MILGMINKPIADKKTIEAFRKDNLSFNFHKTHYMKNILCKILNSKYFIDYINKITKNKFNITYLRSVFISKYKSGHFLSPHSDKNNGKIGFVINLSRNWKPYYGGNLNFLDDERQNIIHSITPSFNNILVFEIPDDGIPHFVSHIAPNIKNVRFAISGWFS